MEFPATGAPDQAFVTLEGQAEKDAVFWPVHNTPADRMQEYAQLSQVIMLHGVLQPQLILLGQCSSASCTAQLQPGRLGPVCTRAAQGHIEDVEAADQ